MKKILIILFVATVILSIALPNLVVAKSMGRPSKTTPENIHVTQATPQLVDDWASEAKGNPHGTPPGQDREKPPKDDDGGDGANKWAVVIGIADYYGTGSDLWHPDEDAKEMSRALIGNHGFPRSHIRTLINREATAENIVSAIEWLIASENSTSTVVFFFSGHGYEILDSEDWDGDEESDSYDEGIISYDFYGLTDGLLKDLFSTMESTKFGLIFGSCHSGGMFDDNDDLQGAGRILVSACEARESAWDYMLLGNTLFGYYFVDEGMLDRLADVREPSGVSIEEALEYSQPRVTSQEPDQRPQISDNYSGELVP